jgi:hypothetical protein
VEPTLAKLNQLIQQKVGPKYIRMYNAGENVDLAEQLKHKEWKLPIKVEWTARDTPQLNSPPEVGFSTLAGRACSMLQIPEALHKLLMLEAVKTATLLDGLIPIAIDGVTKTRYEHQFWSILSEKQVVTIKSRNFQPKEKGRGITCMMIGYCPDHGAGTYRMFDPATNGVHQSRDVTWLRRNFYPTLSAAEEREIITPVTEIPADIDEPNEVEDPIAEAVDEGVDEGLDEVNDVQTEDEVADTVRTTRSGRVVK